MDYQLSSNKILLATTDYNDVTNLFPQFGVPVASLIFQDENFAASFVNNGGYTAIVTMSDTAVVWLKHKCEDNF